MFDNRIEPIVSINEIKMQNSTPSSSSLKKIYIIFTSLSDCIIVSCFHSRRICRQWYVQERNDQWMFTERLDELVGHVVLKHQNVQYHILATIAQITRRFEQVIARLGVRQRDFLFLLSRLNEFIGAQRHPVSFQQRSLNHIKQTYYLYRKL